MNQQEIIVIRESIGKIVAMLTGRRVRVTQRGMRAYVAYNRDGSIQHMNLPYIPDNASDEFIAAIQGFLDHEVGHVLHSDPKVLDEIRKSSNRLKGMNNLVEDVFVERKMAEVFRGSGVNLQSLSRFHTAKVLGPEIDKAIAAGDHNAAMGNVAIAAFRAWSGQSVAADFLSSKPEYTAIAEELKTVLGDDLVAALAKVKSSQESLKLARQIVQKLEDAHKPPPAPAPPEDEDEDEDEDEEDPSAPPAPAPKPAPAPSEEEPDEEADTAPAPGDEDPEPEPDNEDDAGTHAPAPAPEPDDESNGEDAGSEPEPEPSETPEDPGAEADTDTSPEEEQGTADSEEEGGSSPEAGDAPTMGDSESADEGDEGAPGPDEGGDDGGDDGESGSIEGQPNADGVGPNDGPKATPDFMDDMPEFDQQASSALTQEAINNAKTADYIIYSTEWDVIKPGVEAKIADTVRNVSDQVAHMVGPMQKALERALLSQERRGWNRGQRHGKLNPGSLFKAATNDDRLFRTRYEVTGKSTAVSLVVDCSGSMNSDDKIGTAGRAAFAFAQVLDRLRIPFEAIGFTTEDNPELESAMEIEKQETGHAVQYSRREALFMPVFKEFGERFTPQAKARIARLTEGYEIHEDGLLQSNIDGESIAIAAHRLLRQKAERKAMIVFSDGQPAGWRARGLEDHLRRVVQEIEGRGVEVVGIGIQSEAVRSYYRNNLVLTDINLLPTVAMKQLMQILLAA